MIKWTAFWACALGFALLINNMTSDEAMAKCQAKGFSYDTCFHSLNR